MTLLLLLTLALDAAHAKPASPPPAAPAPPAAAAIDPALEASIRTLITVSGGAGLGKQMFEGMMASMSEAMPQVPASFWEGAKAEFDPDEFTALLVPIYAKYYNREEIEQLITFYQSPLGQKMVSTSPAVVQDSMAAGQVWGQQIAQRVITRLQAQGTLGGP